MKQIAPAQRILGALYGSLVGDALGVPVEFSSRAARNRDPVAGMRAYGVHNQPAGTWSDDGSLLLCATESIAERGFNPQDMGERFFQWCDKAHWSAHGDVFDIGNATASALGRIGAGIPAEEAGGKFENDNGNGSLMRILPVPLWSAANEPDRLFEHCCRASCLTHAHPRSQLACALHGLLVAELMLGKDVPSAWNQAKAHFREARIAHAQSAELPAFTKLLTRDYATSNESDIESSGYVIHTLEAAVWCLMTTTDFPSCVLKAVNLGSDTDTTGCVAGGLAGLYYGMESIPENWLAALPRKSDLTELFQKFISRNPTC